MLENLSDLLGQQEKFSHVIILMDRSLFNKE